MPAQSDGLVDKILGSISQGLNKLFTEEAPIVTESGLATQAKRQLGAGRVSRIDAAVAAAEGKGPPTELTFTRR